MLPQNNPDRIRIAFDDHRLVANAGLLLPATLAWHLGLRELVDHHLDLGGAPGRANRGDKMLTLVASALAGGDCIDMVQEKYGVRLATQEKGRLRKMIRAGRSSAQAITRARILIKIDEGWTAPQVATALDVSERTVFRTKRRYAEEGLDEVLRHHNQVNRPRKVDERVEAHLIALACSPVPDGHDHWTMRALAGKVVELGLVESLSPAVRLRHVKAWQETTGWADLGLRSFEGTPGAEA